MSLLELKGLRVSFPAADGEVVAVDGIDFSLDRGELVALVGESGSGKTVTALSILNLLPHHTHITGSIQFDGTELVGAGDAAIRSVRGNRISMIFQEPMTALNPLHTIYRQIAEVLKLHRGLSGAPLRARVDELLTQVGLEKFLQRSDAYPHQLSGGERQRVMIAMAMANEPDLIIADEPTTALDVTLQQQILDLLTELQQKHGMAILLITHDLNLVRRMSTRVAIMQRGHIVEQGDTQTVLTTPRHEYTQKLLDAEPKGSPRPLLPDAPEMLACKGLKVHFPVRKGFLQRQVDAVKAVDDISLSLMAGETLGIVGESGSGKTTLALALLRLIKSDGPIVFMGERIDGLSNAAMRPHRQAMQVVFQDPFSTLSPRMTVGEIIAEGLRVHEPSLPASKRQARVEEALQRVKLPVDYCHRYPHELSGGQRQRVSIARAMVLRPSVVVLDEPTSALDRSVQAKVLRLLQSLQVKYGVAYLFISHDLRVVRAISHRIVVMRQGKIVEQGTPAEIFDRPREDYTKRLIEAAFF